MNTITRPLPLLLLLLLLALPSPAAQGGWTPLFNGKDLTGWKASENPGTFTVQNGTIAAKGPRSHLFYVGPFEKHTFKDFELSLDVMATPGGNGGIFIQTEYQESGWPTKGFEVQVNNGSADPRRTGSLWSVQDVTDALVKDNEWATLTITAKGDTITVKVNGKPVVNWTQPAAPGGAAAAPSTRRIGPGTIAFQGQNPDATVSYRNIRIRPLR